MVLRAQRSTIKWGLTTAFSIAATLVFAASTPEQDEESEQGAEPDAALIVDDVVVDRGRPDALPIIEELTSEQIGENPDDEDDFTPSEENIAPIDEPIILLDPEFSPPVTIEIDALSTTEDDDLDITLPDNTTLSDSDESMALESVSNPFEDRAPETDASENTSIDEVEPRFAAPSLAPNADLDAIDATGEEQTEPQAEISDDLAEKDDVAEEKDDVVEEKEEIPPLDDGRASPPMWRLADDDSEIWLLGTFHILPPDLDWRSDPLAKAIDAADTIYFEAEVDTPDARQKTIQTLMTQGFLPKEKNLSSLLDESEAEKLKEVANQVGLPFAAIDTMRPWQAFLTTTVQYIVAKGFDPGSGVETVLLREARLRGRNLEFFETVEEQLSLFTSLSPKVELALLKITLQEWDAQDEQFAALFKAWRDGDVGVIDTLMNETMREQSPEVYDALMLRRNEDWAARIKEVMAGEGRVLIAVGAGHLVGNENSVPALLNAQGFEVTRYGVEQ